MCGYKPKFQKENATITNDFTSLTLSDTADDCWFLAHGLTLHKERGVTARTGEVTALWMHSRGYHGIWNICNCPGDVLTVQ